MFVIDNFCLTLLTTYQQTVRQPVCIAGCGMFTGNE
jgi:hypothetical protein